MKNDYEKPEIVELGQAQSLILGAKSFAMACDTIMGCGWQTLINDIDENEE
ncbi:MAG TPA: hypothetical protein VJ306_00355 [Pyrinomonadaceae bacterium]|jgi:hypothetical protein|nr:hypothetical protein [Pyrinomonadaceae bacterium]